MKVSKSKIAGKEPNMIHLSQIIKKWRETLGKEKQEEVNHTWEQFIKEVLSPYEAEREESRKKFPGFIRQLQDKLEISPSPDEVLVVTSQPEKKDKLFSSKPPREDKVEHKFSIQDTEENEEDEWDREMEEFTRGIYEDEGVEEEDSSELDDESFLESLGDETEEIKDENNEEANNPYEENLPLEESKKNSSSPEESLNLENLVKTISGREEKDTFKGSKNRSHLRRSRRKRNNDKKKAKGKLGSKNQRNGSERRWK